MGDGAGSSSIVAPHWCCLVTVLLSSPGCCVLWFPHCPVFWSHHHHVLSLPCTVVTSLPCVIVTPCCWVVIMLCPCHMVAPHPWLTSAQRHLCPLIVVLCLSEVGWDECGMGGTHCGVKNKQQQQTTTLVIIHCLVAMSRTAMWHLDFVLTSCMVRRGELTHLG